MGISSVDFAAKEGQEKPAVEGGLFHSLCFGIRKPKPFSAPLRR
jgi:hypothetical protein